MSRKAVFRYLVCATHRSGSSFLCEGLEAAATAGKPQEPFTNPEVRRMRANLEEIKAVIERSFESGSSPNGVTGMKIMAQQLEHLVRKLHEDPKNNGLSIADVFALFRADKFIWISRRDKAAQAVSLAKAMQTDIWNRHPGDVPAVRKEPVFHMNEIDDFARDLARQDAWWGEFFKRQGIEPFKVVYEDFEVRYEETMLGVLRYLGIPAPEGMALPKPTLLKQSDRQSEDWIRWYKGRGPAVRAVLLMRRILRKPVLFVYGISWKLEKRSALYRRGVQWARHRLGPWLRYHDRY